MFYLIFNDCVIDCIVNVPFFDLNYIKNKESKEKMIRYKQIYNNSGSPGILGLFLEVLALHAFLNITFNI